MQRQSILFINGLDKSVNENMLYQLFNDYSVSYIKIAKDHNTRESFGYAFIGFKNNQKADEAIKKLNYSKLAKKTLRISWYNREPNNYRNHPEYNIFVKKIDKNVTPKEFHEYFSKFGNIVSAKLAEDEEGESMGYGFVLYDSEEGAKKAIAECHGHEWKGKKLYVAQFLKNRPRQPPKYNNIYVRNIPKEWPEQKIKDYFSKYGEISSMIVREPEAEKLKKELPEDKKKQILSHKYAFVCFKELDGPAKNAVAKVPYLKISDQEYNKKIEKLSEEATKEGVKDEDKYKCACYILDFNEEGKVGKPEFKEVISEFNNNIKDNDGVYMIKDKTDRLDCCQALKKAEREKKLKLLYEKIKKKIKEKYKFCNLYVKNLPNDYTDDQLKELFGKYGTIRSAKVVKKEMVTNYLLVKRSVKVFGFVCFFEPAKAQEAKNQLKDKALITNGPRLYVDYHQTKAERTEFLKLKLIKDSEKKKNAMNMPPMMNMGIRAMPGMYPMPMPMRGGRMMPYNMRQPMVNMQQQQITQQPQKMDQTARSDYYGEKLFTKISRTPNFSNYANYFSKIVGIFLDLDDNVLEKLIKDDKYFVQQVQETIKLLTEKEKSQ